MKTNLGGTLKASLIGLGLAIPLLCGGHSAMAMSRNDVAIPTDFSSAHRGGGGAHAGGAHAGGAHARPSGKPRSAGNVKRSTNVSRKTTNVNRTNVNARKNVNVNVSRTNVVARPVRGWTPRPYYGTVIGGIALGTVIAATTVGMAPAAPAANMCWFWSDSAMSQGYWDYCVAP